jgi:colanic acid/amylovoran biosynthesis glycosyltransferase
LSGALPLHIGYLVSRYPAISHTFIMREVLGLMSHGIQIEVASINPPDRASAELTAEERQEAAKTFCVKGISLPGVLAINALHLLRYPNRYARAMSFAFQLARSDVSRFFRCLFYLAEAALLAKWMRDCKIRHLHVHFATPAATVALLLARLAPIEFSLTVHGPDEFYDVPGYHLAKKIADAKFICTIGLYARSQLMKISPVEQWEKFEVAPLGVDPHIFKPRPFRSKPDPFEVLCVGRLVPAKGQHILLKAVARLVQGGRNILLRVVGDGPDRGSLEQEARSLGMETAIRFEGSVNQDRIREFYGTADTFALASFAEGIPVVLMEAMAMEIPCVTTWITGIPELIRDGVDGLMVAPSDIDGLGISIARLMDDVHLRRTIGEAGRNRIIEKFGLAKNVGYLADVFRRRLGESG